MSLTAVFFITAVTSAVAAVGIWIIRDTKPQKTDRTKNILAGIIILLFAVTAGSLVSAIASSNINSQKSRHNCVNVDNGYVVSLGNVDYCFEEPPKLIGKI